MKCYVKDMVVTLYIRGVVAATTTSQKISIRPMGVAWKEWTQKSKCNSNIFFFEVPLLSKDQFHTKYAAVCDSNNFVINLTLAYQSYPLLWQGKIPNFRHCFPFPDIQLTCCRLWGFSSIKKCIIFNKFLTVSPKLMKKLLLKSFLKNRFYRDRLNKLDAWGILPGKAHVMTMPEFSS